MANTLIEFSKVNKTYKTGLKKPQTALLDFSIEVKSGAIYGFLGANGAGKTTAIKILLGLQKADSGSVKIFDKDCGLAETKAQIGFLPERPYFHESLTAYEFLDFHRDLYGQYASKNPHYGNANLLKLVGLEDTANKKIKNFSKGMQQRIGIAQALINDPKLVILDEPMSGLDPVGRRDVRNIILDLSKQGKTIFFSSHILSDIESLCTDIAFLEKGKKIFSGALKELTEQNSHAQEIQFKKISATIFRDDPLFESVKELVGAYSVIAKDSSTAKIIIEKIWQQKGELIAVNTLHASLEDILFLKRGNTK